MSMNGKVLLSRCGVERGLLNTTALLEHTLVTTNI